MDIKNLANQYKNELLNNVIPFWEKHSRDDEFGGYFTCLDRQGNVFDTDKFIWLQGREVWMFATLYNKVERRAEWLEMADHGARFLQKFGHDGNLNWYFSLTRDGKPLVEPYNIFSDCFATMAFGQLYKATGQEEFAAIAKNTFDNILKRSENPKGKYNKLVPGTRPLKGFSLPMILCNLSLEIEHLLPADLVEKTIQNAIHEVMEIFYQPESGLILESVNPDGSFSDSFEGRLLNPGHAIEAMWFIMDLAVRQNNSDLIQKAVDILLRTLKYGWDDKYGGIFYFLDIKGNPPQQLEWDQKLWWVHIETLISLIKAYSLTGNQECIEWFEKVHNYTWSHFADPEFGEWFGYLNRQGEVLLQLKGGKWKGCFHVPRGLFQVWKTLEKIK
ncbi:MAG: AGE family epimerase/isomerase [Bacteroidetes bacterium]|nr:MAG: AGE family epimerase/isomerase [Bacteroidota bacterium]